MSEIKVNYKELEKGIIDMRSLAKDTSMINMQMEFSNSKGQMVESIKSIQNQTNMVQQVLVDLYTNTADALENVSDTFKDTDEGLARSYNKKSQIK